MLENTQKGADPELFLRDEQLKKSIASTGLIGGTKESPRIIGKGFALQEDNVAVEFNIPPCSNSKDFKAAIQHTLIHLRSELTPRGLSLDIAASRVFDDDQLLSPQAQEFGCEPDFNAWTGKMNPRPSAQTNLRSAGGHIHIGYSEPDEEVSRELIKAHDLFCGVPSIMYDDDIRRRSLYGKAGAYRLKSYGVEYRTLSNFWLRSSELVDMVYEQSERAIKFVKEGNRISLKDGREIVKCINTGDMKLLASIDTKFQVLKEFSLC